MSDLINRQDAIDAMESKNNVITEDDYHYCEDCDHIEMCRWYPLYGCEFRSRPSAELQGKCDGCFYAESLDGNVATCEFCARNYPDQYSTKKEGEKE